MALIAMILLATVMSLIAAVIVVNSTTELRRSSVQVDKSSAVQAAQAGIDDYLAKMTQDNLYYFHYVHAAEPVRTGPGDPGACTGTACTYPWTTGASAWTYTSTRRWLALPGSGFEYSLNIIAPSLADSSVTITATGRKVLDDNLNNWRAIQTKVRGSSVADFQMVADSDVLYVNGAVTNGRIYTTQNMNFSGTVRTNANVLAEGTINGAHILGGTPIAQDYTQLLPAPYPLNIRSQITPAVVFSTFTTSISTVQAVAFGVAAQAPVPIHPFWLVDSTVKTWKLVFTPDGNVAISKCTGAVSGVVNEMSTTGPTCTAYMTLPVPAIGAIYTGQDVLVSGQLKGRVTIASNDDIYIGGDITYVTPGTPIVTGQDILGLIARKDVVIPAFAPNGSGNLTWYSAAVAMTGAERQGWSGAICPSNFNDPGCTLATHSGSGVLTRFGSTATADKPVQSALFDGGRSYNYDLTLAYLQPPFFPVLTVNYDVLLFREIVAARASTP